MFLPHETTFEKHCALTELMVSGEGNDHGCKTEAQPGECPTPRVLSWAHAQPELEGSVPTLKINMYEHKTWKGDRQQGFSHATSEKRRADTCSNLQYEA